MSVVTMTQGAPRRGRLALVLLIALFVAPLAAAWLLVGQWRPVGQAQHGELLVPARPLPLLPGGATDALHGRWTLAYLAAGSGCDAACRAALTAMRQVRLATGKDIERVQRLALWPAAPAADTDGWLAAEQPGLVSAVADDTVRRAFVDAFTVPGEAGGWIYLVDPLGNLVMRYRADAPGRGMLDDLTRLLKLSKIG